MIRKCKQCNCEFEPRSGRQIYCNKDIYVSCKLCGKSFLSKCNPSASKFCSMSCIASAASLKEFTCLICGDKFHPSSSRQRYCNKPVIRTCAVCGIEYESRCNADYVATCGSVTCRNTYANLQMQKSYKNTSRTCALCGQVFRPVNNTQKFCKVMHPYNCEVCGKEFILDTSKQDKRRTCSKACADMLKFANGNPFQNPAAREKARQTYFNQHGVYHPMHNPEVIKKMFATYESRTGYKTPAANPAVRSKIAKASKHSQFEERVAKLFDNYNISYVRHYMISNSQGAHEFDFYLPEHKFLVDCDGVYWHSYLGDPDGYHVLDCYDEIRLSIIPSDHRLHIIVEGQEEHDIKQLTKFLKSDDPNLFNYDSEVFKWCRSIDFPYPTYESARMLADYDSLCKYQNDRYVPTCRLGISLIKNYHKSLYDAKVGNNVSPKEGWQDDNILKQVILNRHIYQNTVDPSKVLKGFNVSKLCPIVSIFNPVLAKYIIKKYLNDYPEVFDPFSGFSGRLLGCASLNKHYIGQDLNSHAVSESNQIIEQLTLQNCTVVCKDILESSGTYECLFTCPPYGTKEVYGTETEFKSCDDWITECLNRFNCKTYVFVVDETTQYSQYIRETIESSSHFNKTTEYVIVIQKQNLQSLM